MARQSDRPAKSEVLLIRMTPPDRKRLQGAAERAHLHVSAFARQAILQAVDDSEDEERRRQQSFGASSG